jgi:hypothetical protein
MNPLLLDLYAHLEARDEQLASAGLIPKPRSWRSSLEIVRDLRRHREQARDAA